MLCVKTASASGIRAERFRAQFQRARWMAAPTRRADPPASKAGAGWRRRDAAATHRHCIFIDRCHRCLSAFRLMCFFVCWFFSWFVCSCVSPWVSMSVFRHARAGQVDVHSVVVACTSVPTAAEDWDSRRARVALFVGGGRPPASASEPLLRSTLSVSRASSYNALRVPTSTMACRSHPPEAVDLSPLLSS